METTFKGDNHNLVAIQFGNRMLPTGPGGSGSIDFQPGEVRIFSTDQTVASKLIPGHPGLHAGAGLRRREPAGL